MEPGSVAIVLLGLLVTAPGCALAFFVLYDLVFALLSIAVRTKGTRDSQPPAVLSTRFLVLIPAHNEESLIGQLVKSIRMAAYPPDCLKVVVIADNCTDCTAQVAKHEGADVMERNDTSLRGKPYALHWAIENLDLSSVHAVVILDADTVIDPALFDVFAAELARGKDVLQGYFGVMNPEENWLTQLSVVPGALKYRLHNPGKNALRLSSVLAGNAMCFDARILAARGWNAFSLAENWEYTAILCLAGHTVTSVESAVIYSQVASSLGAGASQRTRWHKGRVDVLRRYWRRLLRPIRSGWPRNLDILIEIIKPSYAVLLAASISYLGLVAVLRAPIDDEVTDLALQLGVFAVAGQVTLMFAGMLAARAPARAWGALIMVPFYLCWKVYVTTLGALRSDTIAWTRTRRNDE